MSHCPMAPTVGLLLFGMTIMIYPLIVPEWGYIYGSRTLTGTLVNGTDSYGNINTTPYNFTLQLSISRELGAVGYCMNDGFVFQVGSQVLTSQEVHPYSDSNNWPWKHNQNCTMGQDAYKLTPFEVTANGFPMLKTTDIGGNDQMSATSIDKDNWKVVVGTAYACFAITAFLLFIAFIRGLVNCCCRCNRQTVDGEVQLNNNLCTHGLILFLSLPTFIMGFVCMGKFIAVVWHIRNDLADRLFTPYGLIYNGFTYNNPNYVFGPGYPWNFLLETPIHASFGAVFATYCFGVFCVFLVFIRSFSQLCCRCCAPRVQAYQSRYQAHVNQHGGHTAAFLATFRPAPGTYQANNNNSHAPLTHVTTSGGNTAYTGYSSI